MRLIHTVKTDFFIVGGGYNSFTVSSFLVLSILDIREQHKQAITEDKSSSPGAKL